VVIEVVGFGVLLYLGRDRWFRYDEWDFLASRSATSLRDLFEPHAVHWSTLPILSYRLLWSVFGLRSYLPYQACAVLMHLTVAALVRVVMRRAGVGPWTATATASLLVFLGSGDENILWAFGVTFAGSLAFGLVQLLLADHDGGIDRRDALALGAGLAALMCSGIAVTMVIVVGLAVLARRGWRPALLQTAPLAVAYGIWYLAIGNEAYDNQPIRSAGDMLDFVHETGTTAIDGMAQVSWLGWAMGALVIAGCYLAWRRRPLVELRRVASAPAAMLSGALLFLAIAGVGRGAELAGATRYTHVVATLLLPAVAVAVDAIIRRWRVTAPLFGVVLLVAVVGNVRELDGSRSEQADAFQTAYKRGILLLPQLPIARRVPRDLRPEPAFTPWVSVGWLLDGKDSGRIPAPDGVTRREIATAELGLALRRQPGHRPRQCAPLALPARARLDAGSALKQAGAMDVVLASTSGARSAPVHFDAAPFTPYLVAVGGPLDLAITAAPTTRVEVCDPGGGPVFVPPGP
jgi:hypothetical protein